MLRGLTTVNYWTDDLEAATRWYTEVLSVEPYFAGAGGGYREFRIGDYQHEFGLVDRRYQPEGVTAGPGGTVVYWHVDDVEAAVDRLVGLGARLHEAPVDRGEGFVTATVIDPFGNIVGVMYNPHYLDVLARTGRAAAN